MSLHEVDCHADHIPPVGQHVELGHGAVTVGDAVEEAHTIWLFTPCADKPKQHELLG